MDQIRGYAVGMRVMAQHSWARGEPLVALGLPTPDPKPGEVCVAVHAVGVNPVDWKMREFGPLRLAGRLIGPPPPVVFGVDFAGVVAAVGSEVRDLREGDRVVGGVDFSRGQRGSYADAVFARPDQMCKVPEQLDLEVAAALPVAGVTAWIALVEIGRVKPEDRVLILGASGGVGQLALQLARGVLGARTVGVCSGRNLALVQRLGTGVVIDYQTGDALAQARSHGPFQVVVDCAGGYAASVCRSLLVPAGRHVSVAGDSPLSFVQRFVPPFQSRGVL